MSYVNDDTHAAAVVFDNTMNDAAEDRAGYAGIVARDSEDFYDILADQLKETAEANRDEFMYSNVEYIDLSLVDWEEIARTYDYETHRD